MPNGVGLFDTPSAIDDARSGYDTIKIKIKVQKTFINTSL